MRILALCLVLTLGGCSYLQGAQKAATTPVGQTTQVDAQQSVVALKNVYGIALQAAVTYGRLPDCSATVAVGCRKLSVMEDIELARVRAKDAITAADKLAASITPDQSQLSLAIQAAQAAMNAYSAIVPKK